MVDKNHMDKNFLDDVKPEVVTEINNIRSSKKASSALRASLQRMKKYQPTIQLALNAESVPDDLLVIPLVESGYQPLEENRNPVLAAGIWQIVPETAKHFGLVVNKNRDDRLNTQLSTKAAIAYLKSNYAQFKDWKLALVAYEIGEDNTERLIKETGSRDPWVLASSASAPKELKRFLTMLDAALIIMHNPSLVQ
jgi:soluble lytic murein transglycosylase-like protein